MRIRRCSRRQGRSPATGSQAEAVRGLDWCSPSSEPAPPAGPPLQVRLHQRLIDIKDLSSQTVDKLMSLDLPAGVDVEVGAAATPL